MKTEIDQKTNKNTPFGFFFNKKNRFLVILGSQGGPLERPWQGFWDQKTDAKKTTKTGTLCKTLLFWRKLAFFDAKIRDFEAFRDDFGSSLAWFSCGFLGFRFGFDFKAFFVKNVKKAKTEKVAFVL